LNCCDILDTCLVRLTHLSITCRLRTLETSPTLRSEASETRSVN